MGDLELEISKTIWAGIVVYSFRHKSNQCSASSLYRPVRVKTCPRTIPYTGDMKYRTLYPEDSNVHVFAGFPNQMTPILSPLLLLSESRQISMQTSLTGEAIFITTDSVIWDIEERIDDALHKPGHTGSTCLYREILGDRAMISDHSCREYSRSGDVM